MLFQYFSPYYGCLTYVHVLVDKTGTVLVLTIYFPREHEKAAKNEAFVILDTCRLTQKT
jgi:hypothetical protein